MVFAWLSPDVCTEQKKERILSSSVSSASLGKDVNHCEAAGDGTNDPNLRLSQRKERNCLRRIADMHESRRPDGRS